MPYTVMAGDTLWGIAQQIGIPVDQLVAINPQITDPSRIMPGQQINIPGEPDSPSGGVLGALGGQQQPMPTPRPQPPGMNMAMQSGMPMSRPQSPPGMGAAMQSGMPGAMQQAPQPMMPPQGAVPTMGGMPRPGGACLDSNHQRLNVGPQTFPRNSPNVQRDAAAFAMGRPSALPIPHPTPSPEQMREFAMNPPFIPR